MHQALKRALAEAEEDGDCRALLLTGAGRAFCAGQDLNERISEDGKVSVLGAAVGAGPNIALACDIVLAARSATFIQAFAKIGLVPDSGGTWFLPRLIGP